MKTTKTKSPTLFVGRSKIYEEDLQDVFDAMRMRLGEPKETVTTSKAAKLLGLSPSTVLRAIEHGQIQAWKTPGGHNRVVLSDVQNAVGRKP